MKRKSLLLLLLLAIGLPWAANGQQTTLNEGFESTTFPPNEWSTIHVSGSSNWARSTSYYNSGSACAYMTYDYSGHENYLVTPKLTPASGESFAFYIKQTNSSWTGTTITVEVSTTTASAAAFTSTLATYTSGTGGNLSTSFESKSIDLSGYVGQNIYIAFHVVDNNGNNICIDDVSGVSLYVPSCPKPTNLTCTASTATPATATFSWTNGGTETNWVLEYGTTSDFTGASSQPISQSDLVNGAYTLTTGLTAETNYYAHIKADCGGGDDSDWSNTIEFKPSNSFCNEIGTGTSTAYLVYTSYGCTYSQHIYTADELTDMGFSAGDIVSVSFYYSGTSSTYQKTQSIYMGTTTKSSYSGGNASDFESDVTLVYGPTLLSYVAGWREYELTEPFEWDGESNIVVGMLTNSTQSTSSGWSTYGTSTSPDYRTVYRYRDSTPIDITNLAAVSNGSRSTTRPNINLCILTSATPKPRNLVVSDITSETATVTWTAPADNVTGYQYQYKYATTPTWPDTWNSLAANVTHKDLVALAAGTLYDFRVRANYADGDSDPAEIQFTTEATCLPVTNITVSDITSTGAKLAWTPGGSETSWQYICVAHGDTPDWTSELVITSNTNTNVPANILAGTGQDPQPNTEYDFYVRANCGGGDYSEAAMLTFRTACGAYDIPYTYGFETADLFDCWTPIAGVAIQNSSSNSHESTYSLKFSGTTNNMVALPQFNEATNNLRVEFWTRPEGYSYSSCGKFAVGYMTDINDANTFVAVETYNYNDWTSNTYVKKTVDFINAPANANIAMRQFDCATNYYWYVDDVTVKELPSCLAPTGLAANASTNSAELSWTANSGETAWTLYWKESDATDYTEVANATNPYPLNGLTAATQYQYYVVANCSADDASDPSDVFTFSTECDIITIDATHSWEEGFEDYNVGESAYSGAEVTDIQCWARVQVNSSTHSPFVYRNYSAAASTGLASLEMKTSNNIPVMVALPEFSESIDNLNVAFNYNCTNTNTTYTAELGYITDVTDASTFTKLFDIPTPVSRSGHSEYSQDLYENAAAANAPAGSRVAILISNTVYSPVPSWNFDDFVVSYVPPCRKPANLALVEGYPTAHEVSFTWDAEEGEMFEYAMLEGTITDFSDVNWGQAEETNTASWNNLDADQNYTLALRKVCGGVDGYSPVVSIPFHTTQEPASIPFADDFEDGQKWALVNGDLTNAWAYGEATNNGGTHALYISNDGGTTNAYGNSYTMVYATKMFTFEDGVYKFSYDWNANGESTCDYLRVALVPASVTLAAGTSAPSVPSGYFYNNLPEGWIALDGGGKLNQSSDWQNYQTTEMLIEAGNYMMVFAWYNDGSVNNAPPAAIDNVSIIRITCITPTNLAYSNVKSTQINLTWTSDADAWQICINDDEENLVDVAASDVTIEEGVVAYTLTGLTAETDYTVKVRANCGSDDGVSAWTEAVSFTTIAPCSVEDVTISNISHYAADVTWTGESEAGYTVKYRTAATASASPLFSEDFEDETSFANWTFTSMNTANNIESGKAGRLEAAAHNGSYGFRFSSYSSADDYNQYLVSPELTVTGVLKFFYKKTNDNNTETLQVGYSTTTNDYATAFTWINLTLTQSWQESADITLPDGVKYIAFHYYGNYAYYVYVDDITISEPVPAGEWQTIPATSEAISANLSGLTPGTMYDLQVVPNCDEELASEIQQFSTVPENVKWFITEGNWGTAANWEPTGAPTIEQDVMLMANTTIESGCVAEANIISTNTHTLTIEDGGQLKHNNSSYFTATVKKNVTGYGADNYNTNNGYVLIGLPCSISLADDNSDGVNLRTGTYDLYTWNGTADLEWLNYGSSDNDGIPLALSRFHGFLYANQEGAELIFTGDIYGSSNNYLNNITYTAPSEGTSFSDWNLIGNPFVCDAYLYGISSTGLESTLSYYKMNDAGNGFEAVAGGTVIAPMQGIFCQAPSGSYSSTVYFTRTAPVAQSEGKLNMNLRSDNKQLDNAILVFGGEQQLGKFSFSANSSKIYMPVEGKEYAVATAEGNVGEMPVSFKAEKNGSYTLSFTNEEVTFSYLHLIDNMTGNDVNLLETPNYTFEARTSDYANRFRLVFATGSSVDGDSFGFINASGNFCIFGIEGEATVQVIDILGHVISSETFSGSYERKINGAPGVYLVRLINGNEVRTQKVVVR